MKIGLKPGTKGADVKRLHRILTSAGLGIEPGEIEHGEFGSSTHEALRALQSQRGLPACDEIDESTHAVLLEIEEHITININEGSPPAKPPAENEHQGTVRGKLVDQDGAPMANTRISLFAAHIRRETYLGDATTGTDGSYSIAYNRPSAFNLAARAYDASEKVIAQSAVVPAAPAQIQIDLTTAADKVVRALSFFTTLNSAIAAQLQDIPLNDLKENKDTHELQFLASAAGVRFDDVAYLFIAHMLGTKNNVCDATFFGIFYQGVPASLDTALAGLPDAGIGDTFTAQVLSGVLAHSRSMLSQVLTAAVNANVLPASYAAAQDSELTLLDALRTHTVGNTPYIRGKTSLNDLLATGGVSDPVKTAFTQAYADNSGQLGPTWTALRANQNLPAADLATLNTTLSLGELLTGNLPLVGDTLSRLSQKTLGTVQDLALLDQNDWVTRITAVDPGATSIPQMLPNGTPQLRIATFAKALAARFAARYPTTAFAGGLQKAQSSSFGNTKQELVTFFTAQPEFSLKETNIDHYLKTNSLTVSAPALADMKTAQRLFRIAPDHATVEVLNTAGHQSAQSIYFTGRDPFIAKMTTPLGSQSIAKMTYAKAHVSYAATLMSYAKYNGALNGPSIPALGPMLPDPSDLVGLPDLQALFGSMDYFQCEDCQSVLSPAAYLVDLLQYLSRFVALLNLPRISNPVATDARAALFFRRPDIQYIALNCNNTNIVLPYIDVANEIFEAAIAPPSPAVTIIDTKGTTEERRALPQNVSQDAYALTAKAVFPLSLPFDLAFAQANAYLDAVGESRSAVLTLFAGSTGGPTLAVLAGARLGINPAMQNVITGNDSHQPWERWGLDGSWVSTLSSVTLLLRKTGLSLQQLYQLLEVVWVTHSGVTLAVGTDPSSGLLSADTGLMTFTGLTADVLDRANRFLRLWNATGLQMWELDWALEAASGGVLDDTFLAFLAHAMAIQSKLKLPLQELLSFWLPLETRDVTNHLGDHDSVVPSTYSSVFRNAPVLASFGTVFVPLNQNTITGASVATPIEITTAEPHGYQTGMKVSVTGVVGNTAANGTWAISVTGPMTFTLNGTTGNAAWTSGGVSVGVLSGGVIISSSPGTPTPAQSAITASLSLGAEDITKILAATGAANSLTLDTLNVLLRYRRLSSALALSISDLILCIQLTGVQPLGGAPDDTLEFCRRLEVLRATRISATDVDYLLRHQSADQSPLAFTPARAQAVLQTIRDAVAKLPNKTDIPVSAMDLTKSPIVISTATPNGLQTGTQVSISGAGGGADGDFTITVQTSTSFTLDGSKPSGAATGTGTITITQYDATTIQTLFVNALASATGTTANVVIPILAKTGILPLDAPTIDLLVKSPSVVDPKQFPSFIAAFTTVAKAGALFKALRPTEVEFAFMVQNAQTFNWLDPSKLPLAPVTPSPYNLLEALLRGLKLNKRQSARGSKLFDILAEWLPPSPLPPDLATAIGVLAPALNASVSDVTALANGFGATPPDLTPSKLAGSLADMAMLASLGSALDVAARYNMSGMTLVQLAATPAIAETAAAAKSVLQSQYSQESWFGAIQPVEDSLRQTRRDALVAYLLGPGPAVVSVVSSPLLTTDDIFNYYLIDPEMCACGSTTRLLEASLAIQQFVQQCFLGLFFAPVTTVDLSPAISDEWAWRKEFRLWQANWEVFLYAENYLFTELRKDASPFFKDLQNELRQTNVDGNAAEKALANYLRKLVGVANLRVAAHYNETRPDGSAVLHVFARTRGTPAQWYYRTRVGSTPGAGRWSPWEPLNLDIASSHLMPVVWDRRLHLIWPVFKQISEKQSDQEVPKSGGGGTKPAPRKFWAVEFAMSELSAGQWQPKRTLTQKLFFFSQEDSPLAYCFRAFEDTDSNLQIETYFDFGVPSGFSRSILVAKANLPMPDSPMSVLELTAALPLDEWIDVSQEPTFPLVNHDDHMTGNLLTPPSYGFSGQDLVYGTYLSKESGQQPLTVNSAITKGAITPVKVLGQIANQRIVLPLQEVPFHSSTLFFVIDPERCYLVTPHHYSISSRPHEVTDPNYPGQTNTRYAFETFYLPFARTFLRELEIGGVPQLMALTLQDPSTLAGWKPRFDFQAIYNPQQPYVAMPYPGVGVTAGFAFRNNGGSDPAENAPDFAPASARASSRYNWELFYDIPKFVSPLLSQNGNDGEALKWLEYIFNPMAKSGPVPQRFWQFAPLHAMTAADWHKQEIQNLLGQKSLDATTQVAIMKMMADPYDPFAIADLRTAAYGKSIVMQFLDCIIAWADKYYTRYTAENVAQAHQLYILADMILGPKFQSVRRPDSDQSGMNTFTYASLKDINLSSNVLVKIENAVVAPEAPLSTIEGTAQTTTLPQLPSDGNALLFCIPPNKKLLAYWDTVAQRLYNIRHCLNLQGEPQPLPLYAPAINPLDLIEAAASGANFSGATPAAPIYRFSIYLQKAIDLTNDVRSYGSAILSALEKEDAEFLSVLRANQEVEVQTTLLDIKSAQVAEAQNQIEALQNQKAVIQTRYDFYSKIEFMNKWEDYALKLQAAALLLNALALPLDQAASEAHIIPTFSGGVSGFGGTPEATMSFGGSNVASAASAQASVVRGLASLGTEAAGMSATMGGHQRRADEWDLQKNLAKGELTQLESQITAAKTRLEIANKELSLQTTQISNATVVSEFITSKYTNTQLYSWMITRLTTVYTQAYQLAFSSALQAQNTYHYELGSQEKFVQFGYWDSQHKGLAAGESLLFDLRRMESQYLAANRREHELTKHISLALTSPISLVMLRETGTCQIALDETLFESDHPGQYFRRLRSVALTVPCVAGPYTQVNATLSLTKAMVRVKPAGSPGSTYKPQSASADPNDPTVIKSPIAAVGTGTIATSSGQNDAGMFDVNLRDERWLPFEGQGAISTWNLVLDPRDNNFDFTTIADVVMHVPYTARGAGNQVAADTVRAALKPDTPRTVLMSVRSTFSDSYNRFLNPTDPTATQQTLTLAMTANVFPFSNLGSGVTIQEIKVFMVLSASAALNPINASFGPSGGSATSLSLVPMAGKTTSGDPIAALTASVSPSVDAPQSFVLTAPSGSIPSGIDDILLVVTYAIK